MRKCIIAVLIGLMALFLSSFFFIGVGVQKELKKFVHSEVFKTMKLQRVVRYKRGWFSSTADVDAQWLPFERPNPKAPAGKAFKLHFDIKHGPIIWQDHHIRLGLASIKITPVFPPSFPVKPHIIAHIFIHFDNSTENQMTIFPFSFVEGGEKLIWKGLTTHWHLPGWGHRFRGKLIEGHLKTKGAHFVASTGLVTDIGELNLDTHQKKNFP